MVPKGKVVTKMMLLCKVGTAITNLLMSGCSCLHNSLRPPGPGSSEYSLLQGNGRLLNCQMQKHLRSSVVQISRFKSKATVSGLGSSRSRLLHVTAPADTCANHSEKAVVVF